MINFGHYGMLIYIRNFAYIILAHIYNDETNSIDANDEKKRKDIANEDASDRYNSFQTLIADDMKALFFV